MMIANPNTRSAKQGLLSVVVRRPTHTHLWHATVLTHRPYVAKKVARKSAEVASGAIWRGIERLTFGAIPTLRSGANPATERAREDSNL